MTTLSPRDGDALLRRAVEICMMAAETDEMSIKAMVDHFKEIGFRWDSPIEFAMLATARYMFNALDAACYKAGLDPYDELIEYTQKTAEARH